MLLFECLLFSVDFYEFSKIVATRNKSKLWFDAASKGAMSCATKIQAVVRGKKQRRLFQNTAAAAAKSAGNAPVEKKVNLVSLMNKAMDLDGQESRPNSTSGAAAATAFGAVAADAKAKKLQKIATVPNA